MKITKSMYNFSDLKLNGPPGLICISCLFFLLCAANEKLLKVFGKAKNGKLRVIKVSIENGKQLS